MIQRRLVLKAEFVREATIEFSASSTLYFTIRVNWMDSSGSELNPVLLSKSRSLTSFGMTVFLDCLTP